MLLLNKANMSVRRVVSGLPSTESSGLDGVLITQTHTIAASVKALARVSALNLQTDRHDEPQPKLEPCVISIKAAKKIAETIEAPKRPSYVWQSAAMVDARKTNGDGQFHAIIMTVDGAVPVDAPKEDANVPDYQSVLNQAEDKGTVFEAEFDADLLIRALQVMRAVNHGPSSKHAVTMRFTGSNDPVLIKTRNQISGQSAEALVMPIIKWD